MSFHNDTYGSMTDLIRHERRGEDYEIQVQTAHRDVRVVVMAPHGGGIEPHTDRLAQAVAGNEFAFYAFQGIKPRNNYDILHVTSANFDEQNAVRLAEQAEIVLAFHGKSGAGEFAMVGGAHPELVGESERILKGLGIKTLLPDSTVTGTSGSNVCNRCRQGGIQLELSMALRKRLMNNAGLRKGLVRALQSMLRASVSRT